MSCQSSGNDDPPQGQQTYTAPLSLSAEFKRPDSAQWRMGKMVGSATLANRVPSLSYTAAISLPAPPTDTVWVELWKAGVRTMRVAFLYKGALELEYAKFNSVEPVAMGILERISPSITVPRFDSALAQALVDGDSLVKSYGFPKAVLPGLDTAAVLQWAMQLLVAKQQPLSLLAANWALGIDTLGVHARIRILVQAKVIDSDTSKIFPPPPVRVKMAITMDSVLARDPDLSHAVGGVFAATYWLRGNSVQIFRADQEMTDSFLVINRIPTLGKPSEIDLNGKLSIQVRTNTAAGVYRLQVTMEDDSARSAVSSVLFRVVPLPDREGPIITVLSPSQDVIVDNVVSGIKVRLKVIDTSGIDSVKIAGVRVESTGGEYFRDVDLLSGRTNALVLSAWDKVGNLRSDTLRVSRKAKLSDSTPVIQLLWPPNPTGAVVPFPAATSTLKWLVTDASGLADTSVKIAGQKPLRKLDTFSLEVALAAGETKSFRIEVVNKKGIAAFDAVELTRAVDTTKSVKDTTKPVLVRDKGALNPVVEFDSASAYLSWLVTGKGPLTVLINGVKITPTGNMFGTRVNLLSATTGVKIVATDSAGNQSADSVTVTRAGDARPPQVTRGVGAIDTVLVASIPNYPVSWAVSDNDAIGSVTIAGMVIVGVDGMYSTEVALSGDSVWVVLVALDKSKNATRDSIKVRRLAAPSVVPAGGFVDAGATPTAQFTSRLPGVAYWYSADKSSWTNADSKPINSSQILYVRSNLGSVISAIDSVAFLYVPAITPASGGYAAAKSVTIQAPGAACEYSLDRGASWNPYVAAIAVSATTKISARSRLGSLVSNVVDGDFAYSPAIRPASGTFRGVSSVLVNATAPGADSIQVSADTTKGWSKLDASGYTVTKSGLVYVRSRIGAAISPISFASYTIIPALDTSLSSLTIDGVAVDLSRGQLLTMDSLPARTTVVNLQVTTTDPAATVTVNGSGNGYNVVGLTNDSVVLNIKVSNGAKSLTYVLRLYAAKSQVVTDIRDGRNYKAVKIGHQWWLAQNMNLEVPDSWWYMDDADSGAKYGRVYTYASAGLGGSCEGTSCPLVPVPLRGVCPAGWHVPTNAEWDTLFAAVGGKATAAVALKAAEGWEDTTILSDPYRFRGLAAGYAPEDQSGAHVVSGVGTLGAWWSATANVGSYALAASSINVAAGLASVKIAEQSKFNASSIRCISDF